MVFLISFILLPLRIEVERAVEGGKSGELVAQKQ